MRSLIFAIVLVYSCFVGESAKFPSNWGKCHKGEAECLRKNIEYAIQNLNRPIPELNLSPLDPLPIPELYIGEGTGPVNVAQHFFDCQLFGHSTVKLYSVMMDFDNKVMKASSLNPELRLQGDYEMKGRVLLLPIVGKGASNVTLLNMKINHEIKFEYTERKGKTYMKVTEFNVQMDPEKVVFKFDNLFDGDKQLGDNINNILNENSAEVFADVKPGYEKSFGLIFKELANRVFAKLPVADIFLD